ncbi:hypothetical protein C8C96_0205 [Acidovorax sp. 100]|uniref:hypothetical protein n=1 Tax=Acidovorax sp. 100 TaxID=2135635 RepID=UPI000EF98A98|nr:hypothetical protein [Acidovorax sp. 100]RMA59207.1 hypothetical protein C8C96_0205 [Acidovorax sp. 100]
MTATIVRALIVLSLMAVGVSASAQNLLANGNFESGLAGWNTWTAPPGFWDGAWIHSNDCDIWVPTVCPFGSGGTSHSQKKGSGAGNAHGGLFQTLAVTPGRVYRLRGMWSGGVTGNAAGNASWWEVVAYNGAVGAATIDAAPGPMDVLIARREVSNLALNGVFQFQWEPFSGTFTASSNQVTIALKTGSFFTLDAAGYHDDLVLEEVTAVPVNASWALMTLALALFATAMWRYRSHMARK